MALVHNARDFCFLCSFMGWQDGSGTTPTLQVTVAQWDIPLQLSLPFLQYYNRSSSRRCCIGPRGSIQGDTHGRYSHLDPFLPKWTKANLGFWGLTYISRAVFRCCTVRHSLDAIHRLIHPSIA